MPIIKVKGLEGLAGLSEQERQAFKQKQVAAGLLSESSPEEYFEILYNNGQFAKHFGVEAFQNTPDPIVRNNMLRSKLIADTAREHFGGDAEFPSLASQLDEQGWLDLFESDYLGTQERKRRLKGGIDTANKELKNWDYDSNKMRGYGPGTATAMAGQAFTRVAIAQSPYDQDSDYAAKDKEIRERLFAETQQRREEETQDITDNIYASMIDADGKGEKSLSAFYDEFDKLASGKDADGVPYSPHYATFKNSEWLENYTHEDRLKDYAKYQALKQQYGENIARQYLDRTIQNKVAEAQDGSWTGNTAKKIFTTIWSDLGSNIALVNYIGKSPEEIGILNEGKDPNKPIYDERGNIVDYEKSDDVWTNPAYWNNVYKYNTFSPTEIKAIEERGGISEDVNVREYGHTPDFLSWETAQEGFGQVGHFVAFGLESYLTGGAGKLVGMTGKVALKGLGASAKTLAKASKAGNITNDLFVTFTGGASGAQMEAMGTFEEQMQTAKERIEEQKKQELQEYYQTIDYDAPEAQEAIESLYNRLKQQDKRRVAAGRTESGSVPLPLSDNMLRQQAKQQYTNQLLSAKQQELEELHKDDLDAARKAATKAYGTNFFMNWVKDAPFDLALRKFQYAKGSMTGAFDNTIESNILADATTGGVKRGKRLASAKNVAKEIGKQIGGGFTDEYLDGLNASFASGIGSNDFENYINKTYNPEMYNAATEGMLGNLIAGFSNGIDGITDRNNLYEGFIGAVAPGTSIMVNPNAVFHPQDTWKAVVQGVDADGNKISAAERFSGALMNPLLNTYADLVRQDQAIDNTVDVINQVVAANKYKLTDAAKILSTMDDYSSPMQRYKFVGDEEQQDGEGDTNISLLDSQDQKLYNAFTLMDALSSLESIQGGESSGLYQEAMKTVQGLAEGTLSEEEHAEEVDKFLADPANKSVLDNPQGREIAAERLQKNAQYLLETKQKMEEVKDMLDKSPSMKNVSPKVKTLLTYNIVAKDDYKKRLESIEKELGSTTNTNPDDIFTPDYSARYGTVKAAERAVAARERVLNKIQKEKEEINQQIQDAKDKNQEDLVKSRQFQLASLEEREQAVQEEKDAISSLVAKTTDGTEDVKNKGKLETTQFTEEYILGLDARDKAEVFNPANIGNYTKQQQKVIEHVRKKLMQQDPSAIQKVFDAGTLAERIADLNNVQDKIMQNSELAATYLDAVEQRRNLAAMAESLQGDIEQHYGKIEKAYTNLYEKKPRNVEKRQQEFKQAVMATNSAVLNAYMEDHPKQAEKIQPLQELMKLNEDAAAVINESEVPDMTKLLLLNTLFNMNDKVNNRKEAISYLEGIVDSPDVSEGISNEVDKLLNDLDKLGYQRDATIIENRKQRKQREEAEAQRKKKEEEAKQKAEEDAKIAAAEAQAAAQKKAADIKAAQEQTTGDEQTGKDAIPIDVSTIEDRDASNDTPISKPFDLTEGESANGWVVPSTLKITRSIANDDFGALYTENVSDEEVDRYEQPKLKATADYLNGKMTDREYLVAVGLATGSNSWLESPNTTKEDITKMAQKKAGVRKQYLINNKKQGTSVITDVGEQLIIDNGDSVQGKSATIDEQMSETSEGKEAHSSDENIDYAAQNGTGEHIIETSVTSLSGNAMSEWVGNKEAENKKNTKYGNPVRYDKDLSSDGVLTHKKGNPQDSNDRMDKYYAWMNAAGIKLQNIIDQELGQILRQNPHAKVKFMVVRPENNATKDGDMKTHLMLVLDYDNKINKGITHIHNEENGGVIESQGKQYLVIGTVGDMGNASKRELRDILFSNNPKSTNGLGLIKRGTGEFWRKNPSERFYVHPTLETEVVPMSLIPGYIVKQLENDSNPEFRSVRELLADPARNPLGLEMNDLGFGIQELTKFMVVGASLDRVMVPRNPDRNSGSAFVLIPAGNGKMVPSYLKPLFYNEMNDGALKDRVTDLLNGVTAPDYAARLQAVEDLSRIFHFDKEGNTILLMKSKPVVSLVRDGKPFKTFTLDSNFDRQAFIEAFSEMNPRVNITKSVLQSNVLLQQYDEAGALQTDIAQLATAGSSYSIYGLDAYGKMLQPETINNDIPRAGRNSDFRNGDRSFVIYKSQYYNYEVNEGRYYLNGIPVTDETTIKHLDYNRRIIEAGLSPIEKNGEWSIYILGNKENPEAVRVRKNTLEIQEIPDTEAIQIMERIEKEQQDKERVEAARKAMEPEKVEEVDLDTGEQGLVVDDMTGEMITPNELRQRQAERNAQFEEKEKKGGEGELLAEQPSSQSDKLYRSEAELSNIPSSATQNFVGLTKSKVFKSFMKRFRSIIQQKWPGAPTKVVELEKFLRDKNVEVDVIGTSETDIQVWLDTIENCR